jgi:hypothetical protein
MTQDRSRVAISVWYFSSANLYSGLGSSPPSATPRISLSGEEPEVIARATCPQSLLSIDFSAILEESSRVSLHSDCVAEGEGFEPPVPFPVQRFSRPPVSTTHTSLREEKNQRLWLVYNSESGSLRFLRNAFSVVCVALSRTIWAHSRAGMFLVHSASRTRESGIP